ncbi:MAG: PAS domain-containing protein [Flavobacteriales bacterium]|jgi:PAS domain-containing protein
MIDLDGKVYLMNRAAYDFFGYDEKVTNGQNLCHCIHELHIFYKKSSHDE